LDIRTHGGAAFLLVRTAHMHTTPSLLLTLAEISQLVSSSDNPAETLTNIVNLISNRFATDVCSVYLLEPDRLTLVLAATVGLRAESVGQVRMRITEGLAGLVAQEVRPIVVPHCETHPRFKYFSEAGEDPYRTFLGVPVIDRGVLQGVLVVQTAESRAFSDDDVRMLAMAGTQLAPVVSEARTLGHFVAPVHQRLAALAQNLRWTWDDDAVSLFRDLDPVLWRECDHNPIALLQQTSVGQLEMRASALALHGRINHAYRRMQEYLQSKHTWGSGCTTTRATSGSAWTRTGGSRRTTSTSTAGSCRSSRRSVAACR
jgi:signal transduction protein with GAF and PtsI domain